MFRGAFSQGTTTEKNLISKEYIITTRAPTHAPTSGVHSVYLGTLLVVQRYLSLYMQPNHYVPRA